MSWLRASGATAYGYATSKCCYSGPAGTEAAAAGFCCFSASGPSMAMCTDHCSKNGANCAECGGSFVVADASYSQTALLEGNVVMLSTQEVQAQSSSKQMAASGKVPMEVSLQPMTLVSQAAQDSIRSGNETAAASMSWLRASGASTSMCCYSGAAGTE